MKIAVIETPSAKHGVTQAELATEAAKLSLEVVALSPDNPAREFRPEDYDLVVNRLSATAYERGPSVFATAYRWLAAAEAAEISVLNGTKALEMDSSKAVQHRLLEKLRPSAPFLAPRTRLFRSLEEIRADGGVYFHDSPVFLKLAAGGSGTGTFDFSSFDELKHAIAKQDFGTLPDGRDRFAVFTGLLDLLRTNFKEMSSFVLHEAHASEFPLVVQEAVRHDETQPVYRALLACKAYQQSHRPPARWVLRVEILGSEIGFGAWMATAGNNFCHADICSREDRPFEVTWLAHDEHPIPPEVARTSLEIAHDAHLQLAGIEWIRDQWGHWRVIDINGLSLYRTEPYGNDTRPDGSRLYPWKALTNFLANSLSALR